jgi:hypothetical protein
MNKLRLLKKKSIFPMLFVVTMTIGLFLVANSTNNSAVPNIPNDPTTIQPQYSTSPGSPVTLIDDAQDWDTYDLPAGQYYYDAFFQIPPTKSNYHLVWLYVDSASANQDLHLYSDSGYSSKVGESTSITKWDWIVYRITSAKWMYPKAFHVSGGITDIYICYESAIDMLVGSAYNYQVDLDISSGEIFHMGEIQLQSSKTYDVSLDVPTGSDFDLFVFRTASESSLKIDFHSSVTVGLGVDENITFTPTASDWYAIVIFQRSGASGMGYLNVNTAGGGNGGIPGFELLPIMMGFITSIYIALLFNKKRDSPFV